MGEPDRHDLSTLAEVIALYRVLPEDRRDLMLKEVCDAIRYSSALQDLVGIVDADMAVQSLTWINDTKGIKTINLLTAEDGEPFLSMQVGPASEGHGEAETRSASANLPKDPNHV